MLVFITPPWFRPFFIAVEWARNLVFRAVWVQSSLYYPGSRKIWLKESGLYSRQCPNVSLKVDVYKNNSILVAIVQCQRVTINWIYVSMPPFANPLFLSLLCSFENRNCGTDPQVWKSISSMAVLQKVSCVTRGGSFSVSTVREMFSRLRRVVVTEKDLPLVPQYTILVMEKL